MSDPIDSYVFMMTNGKGFWSSRTMPSIDDTVKPSEVELSIRKSRARRADKQFEEREIERSHKKPTNK